MDTVINCSPLLSLPAPSTFVGLDPSGCFKARIFSLFRLTELPWSLKLSDWLVEGIDVKLRGAAQHSRALPYLKDQKPGLLSWYDVTSKKKESRDR